MSEVLLERKHKPQTRRRITPEQQAAKLSRLSLGYDYWMSAAAFGAGEAEGTGKGPVVVELPYLDGLKALDARGKYDRRCKEKS